METTLYKKNSKGKILIWSIKTIESYNNVELEIKTGEYFGSKVLHYKKVVGKNIGKSNETTPLVQANLMLKSLVIGQLKYGYKSLEDLNIELMDLALLTEDEFLDILIDRLPEDATDIDNMLKPMLAQSYFRSKKTDKDENGNKVEGWIDPEGNLWKDRKYYYLKNPYVKKEKGAVTANFPCGGQAKINGVRCNVYLENGEVKMKSKEGEQYVVEHIINWFSERLDLFEDDQGKAIIYDGELYIHNEKLQYIRSAVVKPNLNTPSLTYEIYDIAVPNHSNRIRYNILKNKLESYIFTSRDSVPINIVKMVKMVSDAHVQIKTDELISEGYEGIILRDLDAPYQFGKRTIKMLKLKRLIDEEFQIIGITKQENDPELGLYTCITKEGREFNVTPTEDEDYKRMMVLMPHLFLNKQLTCSFYEYTDNNIPFHIIHNIVRDYENNTLEKSF